MAGYEIAHVAGKKTGRREKRDAPSLSLLLYPPPPTPFNACYTLRMKKKVGELLLGREEKKSAIPVLFFLPPNPPLLSTHATHPTHEKEGGCVIFGQGGEEKCDPPPFFPSP